MDYKTDRLILHFVTEDDLAEVKRTWPSDHRPVSEEEAHGVISYLRSNYERNTTGCIYHLCLAVCDAEEPKTFMGWCGLDGSKSHTEPEVFIMLDEEYRNKGYGTECVKELLRIAVEDFSLQSVHGGCAKDNIASCRAMEKGGMNRYGTEENGDPLFRFTAKGDDGPIGDIVTVTVDRPLGSYHPEYKDMYYPVNYGYIEGIMAPDGEEQDAYILGVDKPVEKFSGKIIAIVHRSDDVEEKWVVCPENMTFSREEIAKQIQFQEKFFKSEIEI